MLNPCVTRVPQTPSRTILLCGCRTGAVWFARRTPDRNRLPSCAEGRS